MSGLLSNGVGAGIDYKIVDLRSQGIIENDLTKGAVNVTKLNALIVAAKASGKPTHFAAQKGEIWLDKGGINWGVLIDGCDLISFGGQGKFATTFVQSGTGTGNDWSGFYVRNSTRIAFHDMGFRQGTIKIPSSGQHDHLLYVANTGSSGEKTRDIFGHSLHFGKSLGDGLAFFGDTQIVENCRFSDISINGLGFVQQAWAASTAYVVGEQVRNGSNAYICITAGTSAPLPSTGPSGTASNITDGTVHWSGAPVDVTYRFGSRSGISFQRNYNGIYIQDFDIRGVQNSGIDMESTGSGALRSVQIRRGIVDNTGGNTPNAMSFSGSTTDPSQYSIMEDVEIRNGALQIAETYNARVNNVRIVSEAVFPSDPTTALCYLQKTNTNLEITNLQLHRVGSSGAGDCLNIQGNGSITIRGGYIEQATNGYPIFAESDVSGFSDLRVISNPTIAFSGATPASYDAMYVHVIAGDVSKVRIEGVQATVASGSLRSLLAIATRTARKVPSVRVTGCYAPSGALNYGVLYNKESGTLIDSNPVIQGCDFGSSPLMRTENDSNVAITGIYPIVAGNKGSQYTLAGVDDPTGNAKAPQGTNYIWMAGDASKLYVKGANTSKAGWSLVTVGSPSFYPFIIPTDAASWAAHIADNALSSSAPTGSWVCQDASGNAAASIGALALTASGSVTYHEAETGYTRSPSDWFLGVPDNGASTGFSTTNAALPDPANTSYLMIVIGRLTAVPAAARSLFFLSDGGNQIRIQPTGKARIFLVGNDVQTAAAIDTTNAHVFAVRVNETANTGLFATETEKVEPGYTSASTSAKRVGIGGFDATSAPFHARAVYLWTGAAAEMSNATLKALMESFGAGVTW